MDNKFKTTVPETNPNKCYIEKGEIRQPTGRQIVYKILVILEKIVDTVNRVLDNTDDNNFNATVG